MRCVCVYYNMDNIITAHNVVKDFAAHRALDDVSIEIPRGKVYGLLGPNGAGKTTLIRILNHITAPDSGTVTINGHTLTSADTANIGYLPEERGLYKKMKVGDQAMFFARLKGMSEKDAEQKLKAWFERLDILSWWDRKVEELSKGMAQKVQFIVTVLHEPELLIFDEPFSGFDPINAGILKREILRLRDAGATVIFSTHNMGSVEELCDNISLINRSKNILTGNVADLRENYGTRRYRLLFKGAGRLVDDALPGAVNIEYHPDDRDGNHVVTFAVNDAYDVRPLLAAANAGADITGFNRILPSMDEIFISAVENYNASYPDAKK